MVEIRPSNCTSEEFQTFNNHIWKIVDNEAIITWIHFFEDGNHDSSNFSIEEIFYHPSYTK
jgi:hypothetical protein